MDGNGHKPTAADVRDSFEAAGDFYEVPDPAALPAIASEQAVLGSMLRSADAAAEASAILRSEHFAAPAHQLVFEAVMRLADAGEPVEPASVLTELFRAGTLTKVGAANMGTAGPFLHSLMERSGSVGYHAPRVLAAWQRRNISLVLRQCQQIAEESAWDADVHLDEIRKRVEDATAFAGPSALRRQSETVVEVLDALEDDIDPGLSTGLRDLDDAIGGMRPRDMIVIGARPGGGKALALDTPIPTPRGWTTMKDVQAGDYVFGMDGRPVRVASATDVMYGHHCYDVEFSDGTVITADAGHLWLTETRASRRAAAPAAGRTPSRTSPFSYDQRWKTEKPGVKTTEVIYQTLRTGSDGRLNHSVPLAAPLELPEADLSIDPYILGYWLGDGGSHHATITVGNDDLPSLLDQVQAAGYFHSGPRGGPNAWTLRVSTQPVRKGGDWKGRDSLQKRLRDNNLICNKHIPEKYMRASEPQRRALLAGLLDSDGTIGKNHRVSLELTNRRLAEQALELIATLGYQPRMSRKRVNGRSAESSICYRVGFVTTDHVFRLPRKDARRPTVMRATSARRYIVAVRPVASVPVRCIAVDSADHMYLAGWTCIPTHNSLLGFGIADHVATDLGLPVLFASLEMSNEELTQRRISSIARVPLDHIVRHKVTEDDWHRIARAQERLTGTQLVVDETSKQSLAHIRGQLRGLERTGNPARLLVIDYLGYMTAPGTESRQQEVAALARGVKDIARDHAIPVILLAQLNRGSEHRQDKRPVPADLRESGEIEQSADIILLLHREDQYEPESARAGEIDVLVSKARMGKQCTVALSFQGHYGCIKSLGHERDWTPSEAAERYR